jgi:hypothetical protein
MNMLLRHLAGVILLCVAALIGPQKVAAQIVSSICPSDSTGGRVHDGSGVYRTGSTARQYVISFLSTEPTSIARTSTGTTGVDTAMIRQLTDRTDADACRRLNAFMNSGESQTRPSPPWVYFRAGSFYFIARWTPAQSRSNYTLRHEAIIVLDASFTLLGVWTA